MTDAATTLRRVAIDPLTRVEGHGKVTLLLDEHDRVRQARLHIVEFRGFEGFIVGRPYWEVPVMVQRLCGICPVSHHLAASKALDAALGCAAPTPTADAMRRLMHHGQVLQSHALHFFHLASPDLLFGYDAEAARRNLVAVAAAQPDTARHGVLLRKFGQEVIRLTAGKRVHGTGSVPGGVNRRLTREERDMLAAQLPELTGWCEQAVDLAAALHTRHAGLHQGFGLTASSFMGTVQPDGGADPGALELYDGVLRVVSAHGLPLVEGFAPQRYLELIEERTEPWSYMKFPYLVALGPEHGSYRVGPLARLQVCTRVPTPRAEARRQQFIAACADAHGMVQAPLAYHWARMVEMLHAIEVIARLLQDDALVDGPLTVPVPRHDPSRGHVRSGVGAIEAPRGTLIHHYTVGDDDRITDCNLIVSTTHNNHAMNATVRAVADQLFDGCAVTEPLLNAIEVAIRAYDPCLSCATHALGQMPLEVALVDAAGATRQRAWRHGDGRVETRDGP